MNDGKIKHSYVVGKKMMEIASSLNLTEEEINDCFLIGYNHDIGYAFREDGIDHNKIGGEILKMNGFKYYKEVIKIYNYLKDKYNI